MSGGTEFLHTKIGKEFIVLWARACVKALPCQCVWERKKLKMINWRFNVFNQMTHRTTEGWWIDWFLIAEIDFSESPSKIELCKSSSLRKTTARRAAKVSRTTTDDGRGIISDIAARTSPVESRTTTPIPAAPNNCMSSSSEIQQRSDSWKA